MWNMIGYQTYPGTDPSVVFIKSKLPHVVGMWEDEGKLCDMTIYFNRPDNDTFRNLKYAEFFSSWAYKAHGQAPQYAKNAGTVHTITILGNAGLYVDVYKRKEKQICRLGKVPFTAGEAFYLRLLLNELPAYKYQHLLRYKKDGDEYEATSFQEAAVARGLVKKIETTRAMFHEEIAGSSPYEFRMFFVLSTVHGFPTLEFFHDEAIWHHMALDYFEKHKSWEFARNELLKELARLFKNQSEGKTLRDYGLPSVEKTDTELDMEKVKYPKDQQLLLAQRLLQECPLTDEMQQLFSALDGALKDDNATFIALLQGRAGSGKSTFCKYIAAYCRSLGKICLGCASTGLAATVYDDFNTAHTLFAIPVIEDGEEYDQEADIKCKFDQPGHEERLALLSAAKLIIWDEISSQHMKDVGAVYRAMQSFKGKVVLFVGDALQITPVVKYGSKDEICNASIYCGGRSVIHNLQVFKFSKNLRLQRGDADPEQIAYIKLLDQISTNQYDENQEWEQRVGIIHDDELAHPDIPEVRTSGRKVIHFASHQIKSLKNEQEVVDFAFPNGFDRHNMHRSCILATTNESVEEWNSKVQALNTDNPSHDLMSWDSLDMVDDPHGYIQRMITEQVMNDTNDPGNCPAHKLTLKVDDICILMRAVNKEDKFATNTRVRVTCIRPNSVRIQSLSDPNKYLRLPRFVFKISLSIGKGYKMTRHQFPLRLAYSMSINKSQGQQYDRCPVDLRSMCFSHGHLNVALSRIRDPANVAIFADPVFYDPDDDRIMTNNVVYKEILQTIM